ncbi:MAG: glycosyltransferase 87 family protein [Rubrobacter sp.]
MRSLFAGRSAFACGMLLLAATMCYFLGRGFSRLTPGLLENSNDLRIYWQTGEAILAGQLPYRDFFIEYPPGAIPAFIPPAVFTDSRLAYIDAFALEMGLSLVASLVLVGFASRRMFGAASWLLPGATFAAGASLLYPVALTRYDATVTLALAVAVLCSAVGGRWVYLAYAALGFGAAAKLVPVLAAPALALARGKFVRGFLVAGLVGLLFVVPAVAFGETRFVESLLYHSERGLQIESIPASLLLAFGSVEGVTFDFGAFEVTGPGASLAATLSLPVTALLLALTCIPVYLDHRAGRLTAQMFPRYAAGFVLAFMVGSKVLSPQYLLWLLPLVPLAGAGATGALLSVLVVLNCWLTTEVFPKSYTALVNLQAPGPEFLLARNIGLVLLWVAVLFLPLLTGDGRKSKSAGEVEA